MQHPATETVMMYLSLSFSLFLSSARAALTNKIGNCPPRERELGRRLVPFFTVITTTKKSFRLGARHKKQKPSTGRERERERWRGKESATAVSYRFYWNRSFVLYRGGLRRLRNLFWKSVGAFVRCYNCYVGWKFIMMIIVYIREKLVGTL